MRRAMLTAVVVALAMSGTVQAARSGPNVTGDFAYAYFADTQSIQIDAHGGTVLTGSITATHTSDDRRSDTFTGSVTCVNVVGADAWLAGPVTGGVLPPWAPSPAGWAVRVHDGGTPGANGDMAMLFIDTVATVVDLCQKAPHRYDRTLVPVTEGNLVVRPV